MYQGKKNDAYCAKPFPTFSHEEEFPRIYSFQSHQIDSKKGKGSRVAFFVVICNKDMEFALLW
jgi:hypothetical protein